MENRNIVIKSRLNATAPMGNKQDIGKIKVQKKQTGRIDKNTTAAVATTTTTNNSSSSKINKINYNHINQQKPTETVLKRSIRGVI